MSENKELKPRAELRDANSPTSLINLAPLFIAEKLRFLPDDLLEMTPDELKKQIRKDRTGYTKETEIEEKLRIGFWREYDRASYVARKMDLDRITVGICSVAFFRKMVENKHTLAYILQPPDDYATTMEELMFLAIDQARDILNLPHVKPDGSMDARAAEVKIKLLESVTNRTKGMVAHRIESRNLNVNADVTRPPQPGEVAALMDPREVEKQLQELRRQAGQVQEGEVIDVTPEAKP